MMDLVLTTCLVIGICIGVLVCVVVYRKSPYLINRRIDMVSCQLVLTSFLIIAFILFDLDNSGIVAVYVSRYIQRVVLNSFCCTLISVLVSRCLQYIKLSQYNRNDFKLSPSCEVMLSIIMICLGPGLPAAKMRTSNDKTLDDDQTSISLETTPKITRNEFSSKNFGDSVTIANEFNERRSSLNSNSGFNYSKTASYLSGSSVKSSATDGNISSKVENDGNIKLPEIRADGFDRSHEARVSISLPRSSTRLSFSRVNSLNVPGSSISGPERRLSRITTNASIGTSDLLSLPEETCSCNSAKLDNISISVKSDIQPYRKKNVTGSLNFFLNFLSENWIVRISLLYVIYFLISFALVHYLPLSTGQLKIKYEWILLFILLIFLIFTTLIARAGPKDSYFMKVELVWLRYFDILAWVLFTVLRFFYLVQRSVSAGIILLVLFKNVFELIFLIAFMKFQDYEKSRFVTGNFKFGSVNEFEELWSNPHARKVFSKIAKSHFAYENVYFFMKTDPTKKVTWKRFKRLGKLFINDDSLYEVILPCELKTKYHEALKEHRIDESVVHDARNYVINTFITNFYSQIKKELMLLDATAHQETIES